MSLEWRTVELKSIANVIMGQSPKSEFYNDNFEGMPFLQGNKTFGDKYPSFELYTTSIKKVAEKNSVLMSVRAPVGDLNIAQEDICIGRGVCGLQMKKGDNEFLYYLLKANISHLINKESGTVFGSINKNDIETFEITLPESHENQMKILSILKNIDKKIEVCKNLNKNFKSNAKNTNKLLKKVDNILKKQKDVITLKIKKERILDENHEWGLGQVHYTQPYYLNILNQLKQISKNDKSLLSKIYELF